VTRKNGWEDSSNSPDWVDVQGMMRAIQAVHSGLIECVISPLGTGFGSGVSVVCRMRFDVLPGSSIPSVVEVDRPWPCNEHKTMASHVYSLIYTLDYEVSKIYNQEGLWK